MANLQTPPVQTEEVPLTYAPFDWATHPIDTAPLQPQGWGPMSGPWMPVQYADPSQVIDILWTQGSNSDNRKVAPGYDVITLFDDRSMDLVFNSSAGVVLNEAVQDVTREYTSTISNVVDRPGGGALARIAAALKGAVPPSK